MKPSGNFFFFPQRPFLINGVAGWGDYRPFKQGFRRSPNRARVFFLNSDAGELDAKTRENYGVEESPRMPSSPCGEEGEHCSKLLIALWGEKKKEEKQRHSFCLG